MTTPPISENPRPRSGWIRAFQVLLFVGAVGLTLVGIVYVWINVAGDREWARVQQSLLAKGEKLTLRELVPPAVPEDQNFAQTPLLAPLLDYDTQRQGQSRWRDLTAWQRIAGGDLFNVASKEDKRKTPSISPSRWQLGQMTDLVEWQDFFRENPSYPHKSNEASPSKEVLLALSRDAEAMKELRAAARLPHSRFAVHYETEQPYSILLPHLAVAKKVTTFAQLRAIAFLAEKQPSEALADLEVAFKFMEGLDKEPVLISYLVEVACWQLISQAIYEGLARHQWDSASLELLKGRIERMNFIEAGMHSIRGERAFGNVLYDRWVSQPSVVGRELQSMGDDPGQNGSNPEGILSLARFLPRGVIRFNQAGQNRYSETMVEAFQAIDAQTEAGTPFDFPRLSSELNRYLQPPSYKNLMVRMLAPALEKTVEKSLMGESTRRLALIAIALEQYRMAKGNYPASLDQLTPNFLSRIPKDPIAAQPYRYRIEGQDRFNLYSLGWNGTDNQGIWPGSNRDLQRGKNSPKDKDDVVWRYPAAE